MAKTSSVQRKTVPVTDKLCKKKHSCIPKKIGSELATMFIYNKKDDLLEFHIKTTVKGACLPVPGR